MMRDFFAKGIIIGITRYSLSIGTRGKLVERLERSLEGENQNSR